MTLIENPELYPAWIVQFSRSEEAENLRGKQVFEFLQQELGFRVEFLPNTDGAHEFTIHRPWTYMWMPVPISDLTRFRDSFDREPCSIILDCHFPIMRLENAYTPEPDGMFTVIEYRDVMLKNLAMADAVTVPHPDWAADLVDVNPHVYLLPDVDNDSDQSIAKFTTRISEVGLMSYNNRLARNRTSHE